MMQHYMWDNVEEDSAIHTFHLMDLLRKLGIGYMSVDVSQSHVCDTTITVQYKISLDRGSC
jgi:hypothetical protein